MELRYSSLLANLNIPECITVALYMDIKTFSNVESTVFMAAIPIVLFNNNKVDCRMKRTRKNNML